MTQKGVLVETHDKRRSFQLPQTLCSFVHIDVVKAGILASVKGFRVRLLKGALDFLRNTYLLMKRL